MLGVWHALDRISCLSHCILSFPVNTLLRRHIRGSWLPVRAQIVPSILPSSLSISLASLFCLYSSRLFTPEDSSAANRSLMSCPSPVSQSRPCCDSPGQRLQQQQGLHSDLAGSLQCECVSTSAELHAAGVRRLTVLCTIRQTWVLRIRLHC